VAITPHNLNNGQHECKKNGNGKGTEQNHKEITLQMVQIKLESIGIIINVERLMKSISLTLRKSSKVLNFQTVL